MFIARLIRETDQNRHVEAEHPPGAAEEELGEAARGVERKVLDRLMNDAESAADEGIAVGGDVADFDAFAGGQRMAHLFDDAFHRKLDIVEIQMALTQRERLDQFRFRHGRFAVLRVSRKVDFKQPQMTRA